MIQLEHIDLIYDQGRPQERCIFEQLDFQVAEGECILLQGPSGSGKSSLISLIAGLVRPVQGRVMVMDQAIAQIPEHFTARLRSEYIGIIFQNFQLISDLTVKQNISLPLLPSRRTPRQVSQLVREQLGQFHLLDRAESRIIDLSGGEQQRVAIARALVNQPKILLADEPTANLDPKLFTDFVTHLEQLHQSGLTVVLASHDPRFNELSLFNTSYSIQDGILKQR